MKFWKTCLIFSLLLINQELWAINRITGLRIWPSPESIRVVFDITQGIEYKVYTMENPDRIVIDFLDTKLATKLSSVPLHNTGIKKVRSGVHPNNMLRIVLDLDHKINPQVFILEPNQKYGHRLMLDLDSNQKQNILALFDLDARQKTPKPQDFIIAIDPGHGGDDPGAVGPRGTREKDVVFAISKHLKDQINKQPGMQAFLTRNGDYYLGFRERMRRARSKNADLFISVHADSFLNPKADGASVFVLASDKKSSVAARWLAKSENQADLVGGVRLSDKSDELASVLLDLSQNACAVASMEAANQILQSLGRTTILHKRHVECGAFLVLRSPDIPSLLVETGFISNRNTEKRLRDKHYQQQIAASITQGLSDYFKHKTHRVIHG